MRKIINALVSRYNRGHPDKQIKLIPAQPVLGAITTEINLYNALVKKSYRVVDTSDFKDLMQVVSMYNRSSENPVEIVKPTTYRTTKTSQLDVKGFKSMDPKFLENIVQEKLYDMRHSLVDRLWNSLAFDTVREESGDEIKLQITLNVYNDGKKSDDAEPACDGVCNSKESDGDTDDRS